MTAGTANEPDTGTDTTIPVNLDLNVPLGHEITVNWATVAGGSAANRIDYAYNRAATVIPAFTTHTSDSVQVYGDLLRESNETVKLHTASVSDANITAPADVTAVINDNDTPSVSVSDVTVTEGQTAHFTVTLSKAIDSNTTIYFDRVDFNQIALANPTSDYSLTPGGSVQFGPNQRTADFAVPTTEDSVGELAETFYANAYAPAGQATFTDRLGIATIAASDGFSSSAKLWLGTDSATLGQSCAAWPVLVKEGNPGAPMSQTMRWKLTGSSTLPNPVEVYWQTKGGTALMYQSGSAADFVPTFGSTIVSSINQAGSFNVGINPDSVLESNENFSVELAASSVQTNQCAGGAVGTVTIQNDDAPPAR
jgi:hypothetical protein